MAEEKARKTGCREARRGASEREQARAGLAVVEKSEARRKDELSNAAFEYSRRCVASMHYQDKTPMPQEPTQWNRGAAELESRRENAEAAAMPMMTTITIAALRTENQGNGADAHLHGAAPRRRALAAEPRRALCGA